MQTAETPAPASTPPATPEPSPSKNAALSPVMGVRQVAPLLFLSGMCALIYQVAWLRDLRLVFGASTAASAAVLAVFMGGLGVGGWLLGKRADKYQKPLALYANLELGVAVTAAITPVLVGGARELYIAIGGSSVLGAAGATIVRLLLTAVILGVSTFLMGGTLPAAARAVSKATDVKRRDVGTLYAVNTFGAVTGAFAANFFLLEVFGTRMTLWLACLVNALVGMVARVIARRSGTPVSQSDPHDTPAVPAVTVLPAKLFWFPSVAAAIAGFAFLLMELVWYRMLGPILGGSSYTFGLILCVALLGIGIGGGIYSLFGQNRPATLNGFAWTCALEALFIMVPFAVGDGIAIAAQVLRGFGALGFVGHVATWTVVTAFVVLPAAIVSGYQFPLIIALFGSGDARLGRHVGIAYATNTVGSIAGSLAGGFGLIPLLSAPGCWKAVGTLLAATGLVTVVISSAGKFSLSRLAPGLVGIFALLLLLTTGPSAYWRHGGIGAGRGTPLLPTSGRNDVIESIRSQRRSIVWESDGVESSVAVHGKQGASFIVNGKSDGNALTDAPTQVMGGLIGAALVPQVKSAFVVGLGTGSTAGWLGKIPEIERVDVAELEPVILRVARDCHAVNENVLDNPRVYVSIGDAREILLTSRRRYDLIFSEPSNPYRAGVASLYTREFYEAVAKGLENAGVFLQWLQVYDVDGQAVDTALATISSVFPHVSIWQTQPGDLIIVATREPIEIRADALRKRVAGEPFSRAMLATWGVTGAEGLLAHHVANTEFVRRVAEAEQGPTNVDDNNALEFAFARTVGKGQWIDNNGLWKTSRQIRLDRPRIDGENIDWAKVEQLRVADLAPDDMPFVATVMSERARFGFEEVVRYRTGDTVSLRKLYRKQPRESDQLGELWMFADSFAVVGEDEALALIERVRSIKPAEASVLEAQYLVARSKLPEAAEKLGAVFREHRQNPWIRGEVVERALSLATSIAARESSLAQGLVNELSQPFAASSKDLVRQSARLRIGLVAGSGVACAPLFEPFEPDPLWSEWFLEQRLTCYKASGHPLSGRAERDRRDFAANASIRVGSSIQGAEPAVPLAPQPPPAGSGP